MTEVGLRSLAVKAYDAALGQSPWTTFLSAVGEAFGGTKTALLSQQLEGTQATVLGATTFEPEALQTYEQYFGTRNVILLNGKGLLVPGVVRTDEMMCPSTVLLKSEYYNDYMRRHDVRYTLATTANRTRNTGVHLTIFRPLTAGPYGNIEIRALGELVPHLQRAVQVYQRLAEAHQRSGALEDALHRLGRGAALLDGRGHVIFVNSALSSILSAGDALVSTRDGLSALATSSARALRSLIADAIGGGSGGTLAIPRSSSVVPYFVLVSPLPNRVSILGEEQALVLVVVSDPSSAAKADVRLLQIAYGLTFAEARIAGRLAAGATIDDIAAQLHISPATARTHLKRIFQKTDTRRQSDLVRQILMGQLR